MLSQLSSQTIDQFDRDGVVVLPKVLDGAQLQLAYDAWEWSVQHPGPSASGLLPDSDDAFQDVYNPNSLTVYEPLVQTLPLASIAQQFWGGSAVWYLYEQVFHKRTGNVGRTPWHQDTSYWPVRGSDLIGFWISFESIALEAAMEYVRGSHRGELYNTSQFDVDDPTLPYFEVGEDDPGYLPRLPNIEANRSEFDIVSFATEPGDVIAFHTSTLHGGGATTPSNPERRTLTLRYFGEQCVKGHSPGPAGEPFENAIGDLNLGEPLRRAGYMQVLDSSTK